MTAAVGLGAVAGAVIFLLILHLARPRPAPLVELARFDAAHTAAAGTAQAVPTEPSASTPPGLPTAVGSWVARQLTLRGVTNSSLRQDLALTGRSYEQAMTRKVLFAAGGLLLSLALLVVVPAAAGAALPAGAPLIVAVLLAGALFFLPDLEARGEATSRRAEFRHALGAYLDLVALEMAARAAPAEALPAAAKVGTGWPLVLIRDTLYRATRGGRDPWAALGELGQRIGVTELSDLGQLIALVANDGARVRSTLTARAQTMRRRELANLQGAAGKADQSMQMAQVLIGLGYLLFIGYPAMIAVLNF
ncbi:type II secretion system protein [Nakamurella sp. GG22]